MRSRRDHALGLLEKARHDLIAARATVATGQALDTVCFHAQQAVEKSLKALLALKDVVYPWRHDLGELVALVEAHFPGALPQRPEVIALAPYAVAARYDQAVTPDLDEARNALQTPEDLCAWAAQIVNPVPRG